MKDNRYFTQAELMVRILPHVTKENCFALKGGTAINLFIRDMPRLSVDIDLTYLPLEERNVSLQAISDALERIANACQKIIPNINVQKNYSKNSSYINKLFIKQSDALVKIEPNEVIRGCVFPTEQRDLVKVAEETFGLFTSITTLSIADIYGGKICAALDRQHPRDLFDVKLLLENEGITEDIRKAFIIYLISHDRPISEVIRPNLKDFKQAYENEFVEMSSHPVSYDELVHARQQLIEEINTSLTIQDKQFILSVKEGLPKWELLGISGLEQLPAVQWKLININKMDKNKNAAALKELKAKLFS
jgi:predicted nucleotidyltransferase component of viral defense system